MRKLEATQFFALSGTSPPTFRATVNRGDAAMAFGIGHKLAAGLFLDLDVISWRLTEELTPAFGRYLAANLVRGFSDVWCMAVCEADTIDAPIFIVVIEQGKKLKIEGRGERRATYEGVNMGYGTMPELAAKMASAAHLPPRLTLVNLTSLLAGIRAKAIEIGLDLSASFIDLADPAFIQAHDEAKLHREKTVGRIKAAQP